MRNSGSVVLIAFGLVAAGCASSDGSASVVTAPPTDAPSADSTVAPPDTTATTVAPTTTATAATTSTTTTNPSVVSEEIDLNHVQVIGSHNSFHLVPQPALFDGIAALAPDLASGIEYSHVSLTEQLESYGIRQFELDLFADTEGGLYANRAANPVVGLEEASGVPELDEPGFKVMHTQDFDYETTCFSLVSCLTEIQAWSTANPRHLPIMIMLEFKELSVPEAAAEEGIELTLDLPWAIPERITPELLDALDVEVRSVFGPEQLIEPDEVRGGADTLEQAVLESGWPTLDDSRGKVLFAMTDGDEIRDMYVADRPSLQGRPIFTSGTPGQSDAAFVRFDNPTDAELDAAARSGYLIRTRTDSPTEDARTNNTERRDAAFSSGAHYLSTDYYAPSEFFESEYVVRFADGQVGRCNPVTAPASCVDDRLVER